MSDGTAKKSKKTKPGASKQRFEMKAGKRATSYDVARLAGVSQAAVSRCFKPGASISSKMRARVMAAADQLGWQPNAIARGLVTRRSHLVAVFAYSGVNFYYPEVLFSLTERLAQDNLNVVLFAADRRTDVDALLDQVSQYQVDGVIATSHLSEEQVQGLINRHIPVVMFNRYFRDQAVDVVLCDPVPQVRAVVDRLVGFGHRDFAIVGGPPGSMIGELRTDRIRQALAAHDLEAVANERGDYSFESGVKALAMLKEAHAPSTVAFCANDMMALGVMDEAKSTYGLDIPGDFSVVGFDGIGMARFRSYNLTTIRQPIRRMCDAAVSMLTAQIEAPDLRHQQRVFEGMVITGSTIGPVHTKG